MKKRRKNFLVPLVLLICLLGLLRSEAQLSQTQRRGFPKYETDSRLVSSRGTVDGMGDEHRNALHDSRSKTGHFLVFLPAHTCSWAAYDSIVKHDATNVFAIIYENENESDARMQCSRENTSVGYLLQNDLEHGTIPGYYLGSVGSYTFSRHEQTCRRAICISCSAQAVKRLELYCSSSLSMSINDFKHFTWSESLNTWEFLNWDYVRFVVTVVTNCRLKTLENLLESLKAAHYFGDTVNLKIAIEAGATLTCTKYIAEFAWPHGEKVIHRRLRPSGGPQVAVPEALDTQNDLHEMQILLEDDIDVSKQFYAWLKFVALQLTYHKSYRDAERIFSISLYTPRVLETGRDARVKIAWGDVGLRSGDLFLYEVPCSWGAAFFMKPWYNAMQYFSLRLQHKKTFAAIPDSRVNGWSGSWKRWLLELGFFENWCTIYPYFTNETSFSTNLLGKGAHIASVSAQTVRNYTVPLFQNASWYTSLRHKRVFDSELDRFNLRFERTRISPPVTDRATLFWS